MKKILGLITARGQSKGLPRKNILPICGTPCIAYSIIEAKKSSLLDRVIVSTDSEEIANIALKYGAQVPFLRPKELAQDDSPHILSVLHCLEWLQKQEDYCPDYVCLLQPTSPLRIANDIDSAIQLLYTHQEYDAVISVTEATEHPYRMYAMNDGLNLVPMYKNSIERRQDLPKALFANGSIYINSTRSLCEKRTFYPKNILGYTMPKQRSLQIDDAFDFDLISAIIKKTCCTI